MLPPAVRVGLLAAALVLLSGCLETRFECRSDTTKIDGRCVTIPADASTDADTGG